MSIFTRGAYTINFANTPYINAISKYNQKSYINKITDATGKVIDISENNKILGNLSLLIHALSTNLPATSEITIEYSTANSNSMFGIFPTLTPRQVGTSTTINSSYLDGLIFNATDSSDLYMQLPKPPSALTKNEAMALVQKYDCSGAIELSELNTIIFEYNGACFYLTYGNPCKMGDMNNMVLDIDD